MQSTLRSRPRHLKRSNRTGSLGYVNGGARPVDDTLVNLALVGIAALGLVAAALRFAGTVTAWVSGVDQPDAGWAAGLHVLADPTNPGRVLHADFAGWAYWAAFVLMLAVVGTCALDRKSTRLNSSH